MSKDKYTPPEGISLQLQTDILKQILMFINIIINIMLINLIQLI